LEARADKVLQLETRLQVIEAQNRALNDPGPMERCTRKMRRDCLWNTGDYRQLIAQLSEGRHILDMNSYLNLIKEGNDAIRRKELPLLNEINGSEGRRRSRRFDHDFYRTCVSEGLRDVCYRFLLAPNRVGIKLEETIRNNGFDYSRTMIGEEGEEGAGNPMKWVPPIIQNSPDGFASDLIGSGELVLLSTESRGGVDASEFNDPLRGCRYVAAMELAYEPRVRRCLRDIYRRFAVVSTTPTQKGKDEIDAFHDCYGLHLIKGKPVSDHFEMGENETFQRQAGLSFPEINELNLEMKKREKHSCLQYLQILKAEATGDVVVHIHLPLVENHDNWYRNTDLFERNNHDIRCLFNELEKVYMPSDSDSPEWEEERAKVLKLAIFTFLLPQFEAETRKDLREAAMKLGILDAAESLRTIAMEGPYRPAAILHSESRFLHPTGALPIVGVCCASDGKDSTYLASVTSKGESHDYLAVPSGLRVDSEKMREKVILFLIQARPAAVVVGTSGGFESRLLQRKLADIVAEAIKRWINRDVQGDDEDDEAFDMRRAQFRQPQSHSYYDDDDDDEWKCNVELMDDNVAQLFGRSVRSKKEFPDYPENLKCAISLARHAKDPLAELSYAWSVASDAGTFGTELLYLNIHPSQQLLPKTLLLRQYERVLCGVVADVGASLNTCCAYDHLRGLLMLTPGLGPRKAANLKQIVTHMGGTIARRRDLLEKRLLGPVVFNNAVAFLRIQEVDHSSDQYLLHPLDATRLHPDVYLRNNWAIKIAFDALEREDPKSKEAAAIKAVRDVMDDSRREIKRLLDATQAEWEQLYGPTFNKKDWDPRINVPNDHWSDKVEELDLDTFANMIEQNGHGRWHSHLEMVKWEFRLPFVDPRKPMGALSGEKLFRLITGETDQSIRPGKELTGKVIQNGEFGSRVKLEGEIPAFIPLRNMSDDHVEVADDYVTPGQIVTAMVTEVKKDHMTVDMSLRLEDFRKKPSSWERPVSLPALDIHFDIAAASKVEEANSKSREARIEALLVGLGKKSDDADGSGPKRRGRVVRRACTHPAFVNGRNDEVDRRLREGGAAMVGEALIRPSSKSSDSLAIHWVVKEGSIKVIEVIEEGKETDSSIGSILKIKVRTIFLLCLGNVM
jgi:transcription elongation factor SPT6